MTTDRIPVPRSSGEWTAMRTARIGHDLRGPLQSLVAATALLRRTALDAGQRQHVDSIEAATGQLIRLIDELIADADAPRTRPEPFAPRKLVEDLVDVIAPRAGAAGLSVGGAVDPDVPTVVIADRPRLERILSNLLHNAVKYTPRGSITLRLTRAGGNRYRFDVEDTGLGIPPERLGAIFDPFVQLDPENTVGGLGLGLAICKELVERLEGHITVRSTVGQGTVFSVELDLEEATDPDARQERPAFDVGRLGFLFVGVGAETAAGLRGLLAPWGPTIRERVDVVSAEDIAATDVAIVDGEQAPPGLDLDRVPARIVLCAADRPPPPERDDVAIVMKPVHAADLHRALTRILRRSQRASTSTTATAVPDLVGLQLLVADDDPVNADYLRLCLEAAGATVTTTTSPRLIIGLAQERDWSAILVDLEMPGAHGVDVISRLRAIEDAGRRTPIVVVSGYDGEPIDRAYRAGASAHLTKPVTPRELVAVVATFARRVDSGAGQPLDPALAARLKEAQMALLKRDFATLRLVVQGLPPSPSQQALQVAVAARDGTAVQRLLNALGLAHSAPSMPEPVSASSGEELITTGLRAVFAAEARVALDVARGAAGLRDATEHQQLQGVAHRIAGSAGLFGYHELSEYARFLDVMLRRPDHGDLGPGIADFLQALERVAARA